MKEDVRNDSQKVKIRANVIPSTKRTKANATAWPNDSTYFAIELITIEEGPGHPDLGLPRQILPTTRRSEFAPSKNFIRQNSHRTVHFQNIFLRLIAYLYEFIFLTNMKNESAGISSRHDYTVFSIWNVETVSKRNIILRSEKNFLQKTSVTFFEKLPTRLFRTRSFLLLDATIVKISGQDINFLA